MCKGIVGLIFGHKYKPVITKSAAKMPENMTNIRGSNNILDNFRDETFNGVICARCGDRKWQS